MGANPLSLPADAYPEQGRVLGRQALEIAGGVSLVLSVVFALVHDRQFRTDVSAHLLHLRIANALGLAAILCVSRTAWGRANVWAPVFAGTMLAALTVLMMMAWSGGHASPYFGGLAS
jgi:hypothetical protein